MRSPKYLLLLSVVSSLVACGGGGSSPSDPASQAASSVTPTAAVNEPSNEPPANTVTPVTVAEPAVAGEDNAPVDEVLSSADVDTLLNLIEEFAESSNLDELNIPENAVAPIAEGGNAPVIVTVTPDNISPSGGSVPDSLSATATTIAEKLALLDLQGAIAKGHSVSALSAKYLDKAYLVDTNTAFPISVSEFEPDYTQ